MYISSLLVFFAIFASGSAVFTRDLVQRASPAIRDAVNFIGRTSPSNLVGKSEFPRLEAGLLYNDATALLEEIQNIVNIGQQFAENAVLIIQEIIQQFQTMGTSVLQGPGQAVLQNLLANLLSPISGSRSSAKIPWLIQVIINALTSSSFFQNLVDQDPVLQCMTVAGLEPNSDLVIGLMDNNQALEFVTENEIVVGCLNINGGMQAFVQQSPVIGWAWNLASTFGATGVLTSTVIEELGNDLGGQVVGWLQSRPGKSYVDLLKTRIGRDSVTPMEKAFNIPESFDSSFELVDSIVHKYIQQSLGSASGTLQMAARELTDFLRPYEPHFGEVQQQIIRQLNHLLG